MSLDRIYIRDLLVRCIIGMNHDERREKQDVLINIVMHTDMRKAGITDDIADTVNYRSVKKNVIRFVEQSAFQLVEKLAEEISRICLSYDGVEKVTVTIDKPSALRFARSVAVEITRPKDDSA